MGSNNGREGQGRHSVAKGNKGKQSQPPSSDFRYVNYTPTQQDKLRIREYDFGKIDTLLAIDEWVSDGYKFSVSGKPESSGGSDVVTYTASLSGTRCRQENMGLILTARGRDAATAFAWLYYLHHVVFEGIWTKDEMGEWDF